MESKKKKRKKVMKNLGQDGNKDADLLENGLEDMDMGRGKGRSWDEVREWHGHIYTTKLIIDS